MTLIACTECRKEISDKAMTCPNCGAPLVAATPLTQPKQKRKTHPVTWLVLFVFMAGASWYTQTREYKEQSLPPIPVEVQHRPALMGPGMVLRVNNTSDKPLVALVKLSSPTTKQERSFRLDIPANGSSEVGHREGWVVALGDKLEVFNDAYQSWRGIIQ
jgi:hypothetical protein